MQPQHTHPATYLVLVLAWSALFWLLAPVLTPGVEVTASWVFLLGGAGPLLFALLFTHLREAPAVQRDFWRRCFDPRVAGVRWLLVAVLLHPLLVVLALLVDGSLFDAWKGPAGVGALSALAVTVFWFGPLPEEMGWRGFAQDRLQQRLSPLVASLVLGSVWALWHLPLFFIDGTFQHGLGLGSPRFWVFMASMVPLSVLITWVFNASGGSTLTAVLVHWSGNLAGALLAKSLGAAVCELLVLCVAAVGLVALAPGDWLRVPAKGLFRTPAGGGSPVP